jgi:hypothetical protein
VARVGAAQPHAMNRISKPAPADLAVPPSVVNVTTPPSDTEIVLIEVPVIPHLDAPSASGLTHHPAAPALSTEMVTARPMRAG